MPRHNKDLEIRILEANRLYLSGLTLSEVAELLTPPTSQQMVSKLLKRGVELGVLQQLPYRRRRAGLDLSEDDVRRAALEATSKRKIAAKLKCSVTSLELRFGPLLEEVRQEKLSLKRSRKRQETILRYLDVAKRMGRNPTSAELPTAIAQQIIRLFGSFEEFWSETKLAPNYRKPSLVRKLRGK